MALLMHCEICNEWTLGSGVPDICVRCEDELNAERDALDAVCADCGAKLLVPHLEHSPELSLVDLTCIDCAIGVVASFDHTLEASVA